MSRIPMSEDPTDATTSVENHDEHEEESDATMPLSSLGKEQGFGHLDTFSDESDEADSSTSSLLQNGSLVIGIVALVAVGAIMVMRMTQSTLSSDSSAQQAEAKIEDALTRFQNASSMSPDDPLRAFSQGGDPLTEHRRVIRNLAADTASHQVPIQYVQKNPFKLPLVPSEEDEGENQANQSKSMGREREKQHRKELKNEARALKLNMVMKGPQLTAVIDGNLYKKGDELGSFYVEKIEPDRVSLRSERYRFHLGISGE